MKITKLNEVKKEDDYYYYGPFWIIAESLKDIFQGNFKIEGEKFICDYNGNDEAKTTKPQKTHRVIWRNTFADKYNTDDYTYYPRGRVAIYNGTAFIHLNSKCNLPKVVDSIINEYNLHNIEIVVEENDTYQGSHYDFKLK